MYNVKTNSVQIYLLKNGYKGYAASDGTWTFNPGDPEQKKN